MKIWLISAFEPTPVDNTRGMRFMGIAEQAVKQGNEITFFTSTFNHYLKKHRYLKNTVVETETNYKLVFLHSKGYKKNISPGRMLAHYDFALALKKELELQKSNLPDVIFISLPPISTVLKVCEWAKRKGIPVVVDVIDPWPDVFLQAVPHRFQPLFKVIAFPFYLQLRKIFKYASGISAISSTYIKWAIQFSTDKLPTKVSYPSVDFERTQSNIKAAKEHVSKDDNILRVIYTGSLASSYDIEAILEAAQILHTEGNKHVKFVIAGAGPKVDLIRNKMKEVETIEYLGWIGPEELYRQYAMSDVGLTQHKAGATQSVTYKFFDYLSAGLPILNSLEGEMADLIGKHELGLNNKAGDACQLASNIKWLLDQPAELGKYKQNAKTFAKEKGNSAKVYNELIDFMYQLAKSLRIYLNVLN